MGKRKTRRQKKIRKRKTRRKTMKGGVLTDEQMNFYVKWLKNPPNEIKNEKKKRENKLVILKDKYEINNTSENVHKIKKQEYYINLLSIILKTKCKTPPFNKDYICLFEGTEKRYIVDYFNGTPLENRKYIDEEQKKAESERLRKYIETNTHSYAPVSPERGTYSSPLK